MPDPDPLLPIQSVRDFVAQTRKVDAETLARLRAAHIRRLRAEREAVDRALDDPDAPR
jgi:hypothetical protein